jgi:hypothetical protein
MGLAADTVLVSAVNPGAGGAVGVTAPSGDPLTVRNVTDTGSAWLDLITRMGTAAGFVQVVSPLLHDPVTGLRITPAESPSVFGLPGAGSQRLQAQDTLTVSISGGAAETDLGILHTYYTDLAGVNARLRNWGDISGNIKFLKTQRVAVTSSATIGAWSDTPIGTTENLLHANKDYAVLGYMTNTALAVIGIRGIATGNLRVCGPGATLEFATTQYFQYMAEQSGRPYIPVFNSADVGGVFVSVAAATASVAAVVTLILAELNTNLGS